MNETIKAIIPTIASALGGPLAGIAVSFLSDKLGLGKVDKDTVTNILSGMTGEQLVALKTHDSELQVKLAELGFQNAQAIEEFNTRNTEAVNKTMQAEAASEHWPTYSWRPAIGFAVAFNLISSSVVVFIAYMFKPELVAQIPNMLTAQAGLNAVALPVLGIASYFRGKMQASPDVATINKG